MKKNKTFKIVFTGISIALCVVLPEITGGNKELNTMLCPMHIPVLVCGFVAGGLSGVVCGITGPLLRSLLFSKPHLFPNAVAMSIELAGYGFFSYLFFRMFKKTKLKPYFKILLALIPAIIIGRLLWGLAAWGLFTIADIAFGAKKFLNTLILMTYPGTIIQLVFIPGIVLALHKVKALN